MTAIFSIDIYIIYVTALKHYKVLLHKAYEKRKIFAAYVCNLYQTDQNILLESFCSKKVTTVRH